MKEEIHCIVYFEEETGNSYLSGEMQSDHEKLSGMLDVIEIDCPYTGEKLEVFEFSPGNIDCLSEFYKVIFSR